MRKRVNRSVSYFVSLMVFLLNRNFSFSLNHGNNFSLSKQVYYFSLEEAPVDYNRPYLLVFFNVGCHLCWDELFIWKEFIDRHQLDVQLVGVSRDPETAIELFIKKYSISFPIILDRQGHLFRLYRVRLEPFFLLGQGKDVIYWDNLLEPLATRREKLKQCLLALH